jgi:ABC-2 type transport system permease protein
MNFLVMPLFFLSGALFPLDQVPPAIAVISRIDPLSYGVDALRTSLTGITHFGLPLDLGVLAVMTILSMLAGSYLFSKIEA